MKLMIHDGDEAFEKQLRNIFLNEGEEAHMISDDGTIKHCMGCFGCWVKTPGKCVLQDRYNDLGEKMGHSDELIIISKCVYGTYSPFVRNVLDRSLPYIHPNFVERENEMHHKPRYQNSLLAKVYFYGTADQQEKEAAIKTVKANILNFNGILQEVKFFKKREDVVDGNRPN